MVLVRERGQAMAAASARPAHGHDRGARRRPGRRCWPQLEEHGLTAANINGAGQIVAAGTLEQLEALAADPPPGARLRPLSVAGAFHTHHMAPAVDRLAALRPAVTTHDPRTRLLSNADGAVVHDGRDVLRRIVEPGRAARSAGTCACAPWATSASPGSSRCRPPAR